MKPRSEFSTWYEVTMLPPLIRKISSGGLVATIHQKSSYVEFKETDDKHVSPEMVTFLSAQIKETLTINHNVVGLDRNIESSEKYMKKVSFKLALS